MRKWILGLLAIIALGGAAWWFSLDRDTRNLIASMPTDRNVLFWSNEQRDAAFRAMDAMPVLAKARLIESGDTIRPLPKGEPVDFGVDLETYMQGQRSAGMVIVLDGKVVFEKYGLDFEAEGKWTSFSVAKSFTSTLAGAALKDGYIKSLDDKVTDYIAGLKGSAYDDVTVEQLLTMTSGVAWTEDYTDPQSDVALFNEHVADDGEDVTVSYMKQLKREAPAGEKWVYKTGETNLIGVLVSEATGKPLAEYLSEKVWAPYGMEQDATWLLGSTGHEIGGCCIQAATRDYARYGLFMMEGGAVDGKSIFPEDWLEKATQKQAPIGVDGQGYGFQWWTYDDGSYSARGIFGQGILIDPTRNLVIATNSNWPEASGMTSQYGADREEFYRAIKQALDARAQDESVSQAVEVAE